MGSGKLRTANGAHFPGPHGLPDGSQKGSSILFHAYFSTHVHENHVESDINFIASKADFKTEQEIENRKTVHKDGSKKDVFSLLLSTVRGEIFAFNHPDLLVCLAFRII